MTSLQQKIEAGDELLDLVDKNDEVIGTVLRSAAHKNPELIHREIAINVFNSEGKVLIQQRSMKKKVNPGAWTCSAAGHIGTGEDPGVTAQREVKEELGLTIEPVFFSKIYNLDIKNTESKFYYLYYSIYQGNEPLKFDLEEVMDAKWVKIEEITNTKEQGKYCLGKTSYTSILEMHSKLFPENPLV